MRILTIVRRVPDSQVTIDVKPDGSGIETSGLKHVCDPFDELGVEQALRLREGRDDVAQVVAMTAGPAVAVEALRVAIAMGAERAIHVCGENLDLTDEPGLAGLLAAAIGRLGPFDLILCGRQGIDNDAGELGPALAEYLDLPHVGSITGLEVAADAASVRAHRRIEGADQVVACPTPVVLTADKGLVEPRRPPLTRIMKARRQEVETLAAAELAWPGAVPGRRLVRLVPPAARPPCRFIAGEPARMARELVRLLREEANVI